MNLKTPWNSMKKIIFTIGLVTLILFVALPTILYASTYISTRYAPTYSFFKFKSLKDGMTKQEVIQTMQEPIEKYIDGKRELWYYSVPRFYKLSNNDSNWQVRKVEFNDDKVIEVVSETYWE